MWKKCRVLAVVLVTGVSILGSSRPAQAQGFVGQLCWRLSPFPDTLRIGFTGYPQGVYAIDVRWRVPGDAYQFQGSGVFSADASNPGQYLMAFSSAGTTANFACDFQGHMLSDRTGRWEFHCPKTNFANNGTLTPIACPATANEGATAGTAGPNAQDPNPDRH